GAFTMGSNNVKFADRIYRYEEEAAETNITVEKTGKEVKFNFGANYIHTLDDFGSGRLFIMAGGAYGYHQKRTFSKRYLREGNGNYYSAIAGTETDKTTTDNNWVLGIGPGVELNLGRMFAFSFELPLTIDQDSDIVMHIPQIGIYYYFK
ncbi:MAG: hypothetical protein U1B83_09015, partial [Candidatus Cloacimonadaceae bacterium]|nr:hypothetical protein [Candidatus Cloacimonadaceae bacterium]